jgi:DNA-binding transcriptional MerR regulator
MFLIGEFSRIARVSSRLLRYYDQLGLLRPEQVDAATGYRYYRAAQLTELNRILVLKELGFSLEEIARILARKIDAAELRGMLLARREESARQIEKEAERLRQIETRIAQIDEGGRLTDDDVVLRAEPERTLLGTRGTFASFPAARELLFEVVHTAGREVRAASLQALVVLSHGEAFEPDLLDLEVGYFVASDPGPVELTGGRRLEARALAGLPALAACVRIGTPERAHLTTAQIGRFVERSGYRLEGPSREVFLEPPDLARMDRSVVEMQFPVARIAGGPGPGGE